MTPTSQLVPVKVAVGTPRAQAAEGRHHRPSLCPQTTTTGHPGHKLRKWTSSTGDCSHA